MIMCHPIAPPPPQPSQLLWPCMQRATDLAAANLLSYLTKISLFGVFTLNIYIIFEGVYTVYVYFLFYHCYNHMFVAERYYKYNRKFYKDNHSATLGRFMNGTGICWGLPNERQHEFYRYKSRPECTILSYWQERVCELRINRG